MMLTISVPKTLHITTCGPSRDPTSSATSASWIRAVTSAVKNGSRGASSLLMTVGRVTPCGYYHAPGRDARSGGWSARYWTRSSYLPVGAVGCLIPSATRSCTAATASESGQLSNTVRTASAGLKISMPTRRQRSRGRYVDEDELIGHGLRPRLRLEPLRGSEVRLPSAQLSMGRGPAPRNPALRAHTCRRRASLISPPPGVGAGVALHRLSRDPNTSAAPREDEPQSGWQSQSHLRRDLVQEEEHV